MKSNSIHSAKSVLSASCRAAIVLLLVLAVASAQAAGVVTQLIFTTQPGGAVNGQPLGTQPVVQSADASGTPSTNGLPTHLNVTIAITAGGGSLSGATTLDIGLAAGNGVATYSSLVINGGGSGTVLTATGVGGQLTSASATLMHRWSFNDPQTNFTDSVNGVIANLIGPSSGLTNAGVTLLGNNYIDLAGNGTTGTNHLVNNLASGTVTFEAWLTYGDTNWNQRIFDIGMSDTGQGYPGNAISGISLTATDGQNGGHPTSYVTTNGSAVSFLEDTSYLVDTNQHYWVLVYDPNTPNWQLWLDGVLRSTNINNGPLPPLSSLNDLNAWLGLSQNTNDLPLVGIYDEFRIWDGLLSATDIVNHNTNGASQKLTGSASVSFDVLTSPSVWLTSTNYLNINTGQTATFTAASSGSTPLGYQWYFNTNTVLSGATSLTLTLTNVQAGNAGSYYIVATNAAGSASSGNAILTVNLPPSAPTGLVAVPGNNQVSLSWVAASGATGYNVKQSLTNGGPYTVVTNVATTAFTNTGLANGTTYYYVVSATSSVGEGSNSAQASASLLTLYTNIASGKWSAAGSWSAAPGAPATGGSSSAAVVFKTTATDNSTNDLTGAFLVNQMALTGTNTVLNATGGSSLTFTNNGLVLPVLTNAIAKTLTIKSPVTLGNSLAVGVTNGGVVIISSNISESVVGSSVTLNGQGTLILSNLNSYSGGTILNSGVLVAGSTNGALGTGRLTFNGGTLSNTLANTIITSVINLASNATVANVNALTISGAITNNGSLIKNGTGTLTISSTNNSYKGGTVINAGGLTVTTNNILGPGNITFTGAGTLSGFYGTCNITNNIQVNNGVSASFGHASAYFNLVLSGIVSGNGTNILTGASTPSSIDTWSNPSNTFTGTIYIPNGAGIFGGVNVSSLPDSTNRIRLGDDGSTHASSLQLASGIVVPLVFNQRQIEMLGTTVGAQVVNNNTNVANSITINKSLLVTGVGAKTLTLSAVAGPTNVWGGAIADGNVGGTNSGTISLAKAGAGLWVLSGTNSYSGKTTISAGTLMVGGSGQLGAGNYAGNITNSGTFNYASSAIQTLSGVISGAGTLTQNGSGTLTLSGANTYSGATIINGGTLALASTGSITGSSQVTIAAGAVFDVSTTGITFTGSGPQQTLARSSTVGTASVAAASQTVTLNTSALLSFKASGGSSGTVGKISVTGSAANLTLNNNTVTVNVTGSALAAGTYRLLDCTGNLTGSANVTPTITGIALSSNYTASVSTTTGSSGHVDLVVQAKLVFTGLSSKTNIYGTTSLTLTGTLSNTNGATSLYPANGDNVSATINGYTVTGAVTNTTGSFSINYNDASLATDGVAGSPYVITYVYPGNGAQSLGASTNATKTLTVTKDTPVLTVVAGAITYGQVLTNSNLSGSAATNANSNVNVAGTFAFVTPTNMPNAGTTNVSVTFTPTDTNDYANTSAMVALTVNQATATVTLTNLSQTYDGTAKGVSATTSPYGLTVYLSYDGMNSATNPGSYTVVGTVNDLNYQGSVTNTLVINPPTPPSITTQPTDQVVVQGNNANFSVTVAGDSPFSYQWYGVTNGILVGATGATLIIPNAQTANTDLYYVIIGNYSGSVTSSTAALTVLVPPTITAISNNQVVVAGTDVTLGVAATGTAPLTYQWGLNGTNLSGATNNVLTITNFSLANVGGYTLTVINPAGSVLGAISLTTSNSLFDSDYDGRNDSQELNIDNTDLFNSSDVTAVQLGHWSFDDTINWTGSNGQLPLVATNITGVGSWSTNAALIDSTNPALLVYRDVETNGNANINLRSGTIRFWFKPDWSSVSAGGTGPQSQGRLIEMGKAGTNTGWWTLMLDNNGNTLNYVSQANGVTMTNLVGGIVFASNVWHQVVLTYSASNSMLYVDGQAVVTNGLASQYWPNVGERAAGFCVGSDYTGNNQARGVFDELDTYNYPLAATDIAANYGAAVLLDSNGDGMPNILANQLGLDPYSVNSGNGLDLSGILEVWTPLK